MVIFGQILWGTIRAPFIFACAFLVFGLASAPTYAVDTDGDGWEDADDNCSAFANPFQHDTDNDGYGNACDGDLDNDGATGGSDFILWRGMYATGSSEDCDHNDDHVCDFNADFRRFKGRLYGNPPGPSGLLGEPVD